MADYDLHVDEAAVERLVRTSDGVREAVSQATERIWSRASSMSSGFRSGFWFDQKRGHWVGGTHAKYGHDVDRFRHGPVGLVWTANYAAILDNSRNNTLLKAR